MQRQRNKLDDILDWVNKETAQREAEKCAKEQMEQHRKDTIKELKLKYPSQYELIDKMDKNREPLDVIEAILRGSKNKTLSNSNDYKSSFQHDPDYNHITLNGHPYDLKSHYQKEAIKYMHEHSTKLEDLFSQHTILTEIGHDSKYKRLRDIFRGKDAIIIWDKVIFKTGKGTFRIKY